MTYQFLRRAIQVAVVLISLAGCAQAGFIEICKSDSPVGSLSGLSNFTIAGQPGTVGVLVGACSPAIQLPDGFATITELAQPGTRLLGVSTFPGDRLLSFDSVTRSAVVLIAPGDVSTQTLITFTNAPVTGVPEPATGWLFGIGFAVCAYRRRCLTLKTPAGENCSTGPHSHGRIRESGAAAEHQGPSNFGHCP